MNFAVLFSVRRRRLSGQRFVMHFVGDRVGFLGRVLMIVFVIGLLVSVLIGVQRFLQLFELGRLDKWFSHRFDRLRTLFRISLRFFVLGLGQLFGERGYVFVGKAGAIGGMRVRDHRRTCFGVEPIQIASDFSFRVRRSFDIFRAHWRKPRLEGPQPAFHAPRESPLTGLQKANPAVPRTILRP